MDQAGDKGAEELARVIEQFVNRDYYVILAIGPSNSALKEFGDAVKAETLTNPESAGVLKRVDELQDAGLDVEVRRGAQLCGIEGAVLDEIYKPFRLEPSIWGPSGKEGNQYQLRIGGGISETQATIVADFFKRMFSAAELMARGTQLKIEADPYAARPRISARDR